MSTTFKGRLAVIGIGPAGLTAAHAIRGLGLSVDLFSKNNQKSELHGCQYLHAPLPDIPARKAVVRYDLIGTAEEYRTKVYGDSWEGSVSPEELLGDHSAWDIRQTYNRLWEIYPGKQCDLIPMDINPRMLSAVYDIWMEEYDAVFSTIPAPNLCHKKGQHNFSSHDIWAVGDRFDGESPLTLSPQRPAKDNIVVCNGQPYPSWYRTSSVFGIGTMEWPGSMVKPPVEGIVKVRKPLATDCDCWPGLTRVGRFGAWKKGYLVHQVYDAVASKILALSQ